jgi:hypothetical protein
MAAPAIIVRRDRNGMMSSQHFPQTGTRSGKAVNPQAVLKTRAIHFRDAGQVSESVLDFGYLVRA